MSEPIINYGQTLSTEVLDREKVEKVQPAQGDVRVEFYPNKMNVWREIQLKGGKAHVDVPQKLNACQSKLANAIFNLWVSERFIERITAKLGKTKSEMDEFESILDEMLTEKIQAVNELKELHTRYAEASAKVIRLELENKELKDYIKARSGK